MKTNTTSKKLAAFGAAAGIVAALLALSGALSPVFAAAPAIASTSTGTTTIASTNSTALPGLQVGQNFTITSTVGHYKVVGDPSENGTASGTMTFTVTGKFAAGYSLSITGGSLTVNGTTLTVTGGSSQAGPHAHRLVGQGAVSGTNATSTGAFLVRATARGTFGGEYVTMSLDLQSGTTEYVIALAGTVQG